MRFRSWERCGYSALQAGVAFLPFAAGVLTASTLVARVMTRLRAGLLLAAGLMLAAAGMGWLTRLGVDSGYTSHVLPAVLLIGVGLGTMGRSQPTSPPTRSPNATPESPAPSSTSPNRSARRSGSAILNTIATTSTQTYLTAHAPGEATRLAATVHGYTTATTWAAGILVSGAVVVLALVNARLGTTPSQEPAAPAATPTPDQDTAQPALILTAPDAHDE